MTPITPDDVSASFGFSVTKELQLQGKLREQHGTALKEVADILGEVISMAKYESDEMAMKDLIMLPDGTTVIVHTRKEVMLDCTRFVTSTSLHIDNEVQHLRCADFTVHNTNKSKEITVT